MKLYELNEAFVTVRSLFDDGLIDKQAFTDTIEQIEIDLEEKIKNCVIMMREHESKASVIKSEIDRLSKLAKAELSAAEWLEDYISQSMKSTEKDKIDLGLFKLTLKAPSKAVEIIDESLIPIDYMKIIPESKVPDKSLIAKALKDNFEIKGVKLVDGKRALLIK